MALAVTLNRILGLAVLERLISLVHMQVMYMFRWHYGSCSRFAKPAAYVHVNILCIADSRKQVSLANCDLAGRHQNTAYSVHSR
jgi:hypothetical protein